MEGSVVTMEHKEDTHSEESLINSPYFERQLTVWAHLPHDTDWSIKSYKKIRISILLIR